MSTIEDGKGTGNKAHVTENNRLDVSAKMGERIYYIARTTGKAFMTNFTCTQTAGGTAEGLVYVLYTGSDRLFISGVSVCTEEPGTGLTKFGFWTDPTTYSGGDTKVAVNTNTSSAISSETTCKQNNDGTPLSISGGNAVYTLRLSGINTYNVDFKGTVILVKNKIFAIKVSAATLGTKTRATVIWYEEDVS